MIMTHQLPRVQLRNDGLDRPSIVLSFHIHVKHIAFNLDL
jgi:hypothetical protein